MNLVVASPAALIAVLIALVVLAALQDGWQLRISNLLSGAIIVAAFVAVALDGPAGGLWQNLALFVAVLAIGTMLHASGKIGGGDIKLLAATILWFDLAGAWRFLAAVFLAGGAVALVTIALRTLPIPAGVRGSVRMLQPGGGIPYGLAIAAGTVASILLMRS